MTIFGFLSCAVLALAPFDQGHADSRYDVISTPAWVVPAPVTARESPDLELHKGGADFLLVDHQIRLGMVESHYARFVTRLTNVSGIEDHSQITINFDPKIERLHLHYVLVRRGSIAIDQLRRGRVRVIQRENNLEDQLVDGELTFHLVMADVRVGDVVDYSYTLERRNAEWGDRGFGRLSTQWSSPVGRSRIKLLSPVSATLKTFSDSTNTPKTWVASGLKIVEWSADRVKPVKFEDDAPSWFQQYGSIEYSQFSNWGEIVEAAIPLYAATGTPSIEFKELVSRFARTAATEAERAIAAMKFVQDEIRYTGIEEGEGAYRPTPPIEVLARRYGDCKDKTLLAVSLLKALGIEAAPALVSTRWKAEVGNHLPSPGLMNHVVVRAVLNGQVYWFDATATGQGGRLANFTQASFGKALVISPGTAALETMMPVEVSKPLIRSEVVFDLRAGLYADSGLKVTTTYFDAEADRMRRRLEGKGIADLEQKYLHYYKGQYPDARSAGPLQVTDKLEENQLSVAESYRIRDGFEKDREGRQKLYVNADTITDILGAPELPERTTPLALEFPKYLSTNIQLLLPTAWDVDLETVKIDTPHFHYASSVGYRDKVISLGYEYRALKDRVLVSELPAHIKQLERARDDTYFNISRTAKLKTEQVLQEKYWAVKLAALFAGVFLALRFGRYALTVQVLLTTTLSRVTASDCAESDVPEGELSLIKSLDDQLIGLGFEPLGVARYSSLYTRYDKPEFLRVLGRADLPAMAYVSRHHAPEYGAYVRMWLETEVVDGTKLLTTDGFSDGKIGAPQVLAEAVKGASVPHLVKRHEERIKELAVKGVGAAAFAPGDGLAARVAADFGAVRAEWSRNGWIRATANPDLERMTFKGAMRLARSAILTQSARASGPTLLKSAQSATALDHAARADADFIAAWHLAKAPRNAPGPNWAAMLFAATFIMIGLGAMAVMSGVYEATVMLCALALHEAAHLFALGKQRAAPGLLFLMPFAGLIKADSSDEVGLGRRAGVILAGPMLGLLTGVMLLLADALWPSHYCRQAASIFIGLNGLLLIPYPGTDGSRIVAASTAPGSLVRAMAQLLSVVVLLAIGLRSESQFLNTMGFLLAVWFLAQLRTFKLIRKIAQQIPPGSNWEGAAQAAFLAMTAPGYARWGASVRQLRGISIANELTRPATSGREQVLAIIAYGSCAVLAVCAALQGSV